MSSSIFLLEQALSRHDQPQRDVLTYLITVVKNEEKIL